MQKTDDLAARTLTIERKLDAPVKLVWEAWSNPEHISKWWGPKGMKTRVIEHQFEAGGNWKYAMEMPDGNEFITEGVYSEIVPFEKIISSADFKPMTEGVELHVHFEALGEETLFTFKVVHPTIEYCQAQEKMGFYNGWGSVFDNLAKFVAQ